MILTNLAYLTAGESLGETMARAGLNTVMGIGIVFLALAFISIVIAIQGKIFQAIANKKSAPKTVEAPKPAVVEEPVEELSDDEELVAVITAAIYAFEAEAGDGYVPADGLVVRSIRRRR
ncbi:MAG: OadG family protein [Lachnospiraceae bacterium]|nr:OadG family protein [Lachnospiraceae bacterium]